MSDKQTNAVKSLKIPKQACVQKCMVNTVFVNIGLSILYPVAAIVPIFFTKVPSADFLSCEDVFRLCDTLGVLEDAGLGTSVIVNTPETNPVFYFTEK